MLVYETRSLLLNESEEQDNNKFSPYGNRTYNYHYVQPSVFFYNKYSGFIYKYFLLLPFIHIKNDTIIYIVTFFVLANNIT